MNPNLLSGLNPIVQIELGSALWDAGAATPITPSSSSSPATAEWQWERAYLFNDAWQVAATSTSTSALHSTALHIRVLDRASFGAHTPLARADVALSALLTASNQFLIKHQWMTLVSPNNFQKSAGGNHPLTHSLPPSPLLSVMCGAVLCCAVLYGWCRDLCVDHSGSGPSVRRRRSAGRLHLHLLLRAVSFSLPPLLPARL